MKPPKLIELKPAEVEALLERVEHKTLQEGDYEIVCAERCLPPGLPTGSVRTNMTTRPER